MQATPPIVSKLAGGASVHSGALRHRNLGTGAGGEGQGEATIVRMMSDHSP